MGQEVQSYFRQKALKVATKLAAAYMILPSTLLLVGVKEIENKPRADGSFASVYYGKLEDQAVAIKRLKGFSEAKELRFTQVSTFLRGAQKGCGNLVCHCAGLLSRMYPLEKPGSSACFAFLRCGG